MKIFFTYSKSGRKQYSQLNKLVLGELRKHKVDVITTRKEGYLADKPKLKGKSISESEDKYRHLHDSIVKRTIFVSDGVVIEASHQSFRLGFEAHFALTQQKPVLILSSKHNYANLISHPNFFGAKYSQFTLPDEIEKFINHVKKYKLRNRFNLFISDREKKYLQNVAKVNNLSMSSYLRKLVQQDIADLEV
jgi:hypothetical protein